MSNLTLLRLASSAPLFFASAAFADESVSFKASDASEGDQYGVSVEFSGEHVLVGAPSKEGPGSLANVGAVYVHNAGSGTELLQLLPSNLPAESAFGGSLQVDGQTLVVGASGSGIRRGAAYLYSTSSWTQIQKLVASDVNATDRFGQSVAIHGNLVVVGSPMDDDLGADSGSAYLFDATTGMQLAKLTASDGKPGDQFGSAVAVGPNYLAVSAVNRDDPLIGNAAGGVYIFDSATSTELRLILHHPTDATGHRFGNALAMDGDLLLAGAYADDWSGTIYTGSAQLHDLAAGTLLHEFRHQFGLGISLGHSVDLAGTTAVVGAPLAPFGSVYFPEGAVYAYDTITGDELAVFETAQPNYEGLMGRAVAIDGSRVVAGAPYANNLGAVDSGRAFRFELGNNPGTIYCVGTGCPCGNDSPNSGCINSAGVGAALHADGSASVAADDLRLTATNLPPNTFGLFFMGSQSTSVPFGDGIRCAGGSLLRFQPASNSGANGSIRVGPGVVGLSCSLSGGTSCITAGSTWQFQAWYRDAQGPCSQGFNVSNATSIQFTL